MQQGGMYWDGKKYVPTKGTGTYQQGMYFADGGYTDANAPQLYTANGMSQWQGQGVDFRSPNPYAPQMPMMSKPMMPQMPLMGGGDSQATYGNYGQGYGPEPVGNGAAGDVFANAHGYRDGGKVPMNYRSNPSMKQQINGPYHNGYNLPDPSSYNDSTTRQYTGNPGVNQQMMNKYLPQKPWNTPNPQQDWMQEGFNPHNTDADRYQFKSGGIHIKPENRGKFTAYKERTGKTTEEALHSPDPHVRQMANFARNAKKWHHQFGGATMPQYDSGGGYMNNAWASVNPQDDITAQMYEQRANTQDVVQNSDMYNRPNITGINPDGMTPMDNNIVPGQQAMQQPMQYTQQRPFGTNTKNLLGAGLIAAGYFADRKNEKDRAQRAMQNGMTSMNGMNPMDYKGNYSQNGTFRPNQRGYSNPGMYYPGYAMGGPAQVPNNPQISQEFLQVPQEKSLPINGNWNDESYSGMNFSAPLKNGVELQGNYDPRFAGQGDANWSAGVGIPVQNIQKGVKSLFNKRKYQTGGNVPQYAQGGVYEMDHNSLAELTRKGYKFELV